MLNFMKRNSLNIVLVMYFIVLFTSLHYLGYDEGREFPYELLDKVATVGWTLLPIIMCLVMVAFIKNMAAFREAQVSLLNSKSDLNSALADKAEADTWATRAHTKAFRNNNS